MSVRTNELIFFQVSCDGIMIVDHINILVVRFGLVKIETSLWDVLLLKQSLCIRIKIFKNALIIVNKTKTMAFVIY